MDEAELWPLRDDARVKAELTARYLAFAKGIAFRYSRNNENSADLVQVANVGLVNAIHRFDPEKGKPFLAFASPTIHGELRRHFRDRGSMLHVPRSVYERIGQIERASDGLRSGLQREPTDLEVAGEIGCSESDVVEARQAILSRNADSLDGLPDESREVPRMEAVGVIDHELETAEDRLDVGDAFNSLEAEERQIILYRFRDEMSQHQIAERLGCSQMHVSRRLSKILDKMGDAVAGAAVP